MLLNPFTLHQPRTITELVDLYGPLNGKARLLAGGTFLLNSLKAAKRRGRSTPAHIITLQQIPELHGIALEKDRLIIRAMTTLNEMGDMPVIAGHFPVLKKVCDGVGTTSIRNMATVGGNVTCRYTWTELPAVMIALEAQFHFTNARGGEDIVDAEVFFRNEARTDQVLTRITVPQKNGLVSSYQRAARTSGVDIPMVAVCAKGEVINGCLRHPRVVVNTAVSFPRRDLSVEKFLEGKSVTTISAQDVLAHRDNAIYGDGDDYKRHMYEVCLRDAIDEIAGR